jgi:hypothetical protein
VKIIFVYFSGVVKCIVKIVTQVLWPVDIFSVD